MQEFYIYVFIFIKSKKKHTYEKFIFKYIINHI